MKPYAERITELERRVDDIQRGAFTTGDPVVDRSLCSVVEQIRRLPAPVSAEVIALRGRIGTLQDTTSHMERDLVRYIGERNQLRAALAVLVERHGQKCWTVCGEDCAWKVAADLLHEIPA